MNCEVCGTELPHGALFCGECGRAVGTRATRPLHPDSGMPVDAAAESAVVRKLRPVRDDTAIIEPVVRSELPEPETKLPFLPVSEDIEQDLPPEVMEAEIAAAKVAGSASATAAVEGAEIPADIEPDPEPEVEPEPNPEAEPEAEAEPASEPRRMSGAIPPPRPDPFPWGDRGAAIFSDSDELEQTLIVPRRDTGERFVLQFSTGESVTVFGSGLLGRNPSPQPTEYFDQLVSISDPGKSVSKTHLEFGQEAGAFWVSDRFSGNGSAVREPESSPRRLVAGRRYRIVRGTRVDIGEQFFVVS